MIDAHCHLNFSDFTDDLDEVVSRAHDAGVTMIISTGTSLEMSQKAVSLAENHSDMYAIIGIHPIHANDPQPDDWLEKLEALAKHEKVIGIGEIGLDYYHLKIEEEKIKQEEFFRKQLDLAVRIQRPIQIHNRHAGEDVLKIISDYQEKLVKPIGMMHCFAGSMEVLKKALDLGMYIGIDGNVTYPGIAKGETVSLVDIVLKVPLDRLVIETDSPFLAPIPYRGKRNEPKNVILVADKIAEIKNMNREEVALALTQNTQRLFTL